MKSQTLNITIVSSCKGLLCLFALHVSSCNNQLLIESPPSVDRINIGLNEKEELRTVTDMPEQQKLIPFEYDPKVIQIQQGYLQNNRASLLRYTDQNNPDRIKWLQENSTYLNIFYLTEQGVRFSIKTKSTPHKYLSSTGNNKILYFQNRATNSSQEFTIKVYPPSSGIEYTIHSTDSNSGILGDAILSGNDSGQHYACFFLYNSNKSIHAKNWQLPVDENGFFRILNRDASIYTPPKEGEGGYGTLTTRAIEIGSDGSVLLNPIEEKDYSTIQKQLFVIKPNQKVSISHVDYLSESNGNYGIDSEVTRLSDFVVNKVFTNGRTHVWEETVPLDFFLEEESSFREYTGLSFDISNANTKRLKTPEVFGGMYQSTPSENAEALSFYMPNQKVRREVRDMTFKFEMPPKSRATVTYKIPRYRVKCPYKLTLVLDGSPNTQLTVYGYWHGIVHSLTDAEDPELTVTTTEGKYARSRIYTLPLTLANGDEPINLLRLKQMP